MYGCVSCLHMMHTVSVVVGKVWITYWNYISNFKIHVNSIYHKAKIAPDFQKDDIKNDICRYVFWSKMPLIEF